MVWRVLVGRYLCRAGVWRQVRALVVNGVLIAVGERQLRRHRRATGTVRAVFLAQRVFMGYAARNRVTLHPRSAERASWMQGCKNDGGDEHQRPVGDHESRFGLEQR